MKAVVLSGGEGTRLRPLTYSVPKQLIPVGGQSVLGRVLDDIVDAGIDEIAVVTSPRAADAVGKLVQERPAMSVVPQVLIQPEPKGLADAFKIALPFVDGEPSLLYLGDCLLTGGIGHMVDAANSSEAAATVMVAEVDDPSRYGVVELGPDGSIVRLVEKPTDPPSNLAIVGVYVFAAGVEEAVHAVTPSWRGEYEITDALQEIIDSGGVVNASRLVGSWLDVGTNEDLLGAQALILGDLVPRNEGIVESSKLSGAVAVESAGVVTGSTITGPVIVGNGAVVESSRIGPYTTIGAGARVLDSTVTRSILMDEIVVESSHLEDSILGPRAEVRGHGRDSSLAAIVGADASIVSSIVSQSG